MALRLIDNDAPYSVPVTVLVPDHGKMREVKFTILAKVISDEEIKSLGESGDIEALNKLVTGWSGMKDLDHNEVPCTEETRALVFGIANYRGAILDAIFKSRTGRARGN